MSENTNVFTKDPNATLPYSVDWGANWLGSDTIAASSWTVPAGLTQVSSSFTTKIATVVISGGVAGQSYDIVNRITTALGYIDDRTLTLLVSQK